MEIISSVVSFFGSIIGSLIRVFARKPSGAEFIDASSIPLIISNEKGIVPSEHLILDKKRTTLISQIESDVSKSISRTLITGIVGIGKTQICRYIYNHFLDKMKFQNNSSVQHIAYMTYTKNIGNTIYKRLLVGCRIKKRDVWDVLDKICSNGKTLIIIDNITCKDINNDKDFSKLKNLHANIILSSMQSNISTFKKKPVLELSYDESRKLYNSIRERKVKTEEENDMKEILTSIIFRHTLTIVVLANLANRNDWSVSTLKENIVAEDIDLSKYKEDDTSLIAFYKSIIKLFNFDKEEIVILEAFSIFPYKTLSFNACGKMLYKDANIKNNNHFHQLSELGWLEKDEIGYKMHPFISKAISKGYGFKVSRHDNMFSECKSILEKYIQNPNLYSDVDLDFIEQIALNILSKKTQESFALCIRIAHYYFTEEDYDVSEQWYDSADKIIKQTTLSDSSGDISYYCYNRGQYYFVKEDYDNALKFYFIFIRENKLKLIGDELKKENPSTNSIRFTERYVDSRFRENVAGKIRLIYELLNPNCKQFDTWFNRRVRETFGMPVID
jgi:CRISPR/Cas system CSM-associated protein Csm2 small subunit